MSDRLKQIWSGFEGQTTRNLTGSGVDNIHVPHRREWRNADEQFVPEGFETPAERAYAALSWKLSEQEKKFSKKKKRQKLERDIDGRTSNLSYDAGDQERATAHYTNEADQDQALISSLRETDFRILRREINYMNAGGAAMTDDKLKRKGKKKFLGIF